MSHWSEENYVLGYAYASGRNDAGDMKHKPEVFAKALASSIIESDGITFAQTLWWKTPTRQLNNRRA